MLDSGDALRHASRPEGAAHRWPSPLRTAAAVPASGAGPRRRGPPAAGHPAARPQRRAGAAATAVGETARRSWRRPRGRPRPRRQLLTSPPLSERLPPRQLSAHHTAPTSARPRCCSPRRSAPGPGGGAAAAAVARRRKQQQQHSSLTLCGARPPCIGSQGPPPPPHTHPHPHTSIATHRVAGPPPPSPPSSAYIAT